MRGVLRHVAYTQRRVLVYSALLRLSLTLQCVSAPIPMQYNLRVTYRQEFHERRLSGTVWPYDSDATDHQDCQ